MTLEGTVHRTFFLLCLVTGSAGMVWGLMRTQPELMLPAFIGGALASLVLCLITVFKKQWSPITAPMYAVTEGLSLGVISYLYESAYNGIVFQAIGLTLGTLFCLLAAYKSGLIKATEKFKLGVIAATGGVFVLYMVSLFMTLVFHTSVPMIHNSGPTGIFFSLVVVVIAALNLVLDFDFIERGVEYGAPKYMEWYGAFGLMVTLIWLYLEILRLLSKLNRRN